MVRSQTTSRIQKSCLIAILLIGPILSWAITHDIGKVTQVEGEATFLSFLPPSKIQKVKVGDAVKTEGSYLSSEDGFMTLKLYDHAYLRLTPQSKISFEFSPKEGLTTVYLLSGSFKALFAQNDKSPMAKKLVVRSGSTVFETVNGKFTVVRNILNSSNSVYVEKGTVIATQFYRLEKGDSEIVHAKEGATVLDNQKDVPSPVKLSEKELRFLHPSNYLKKRNAGIKN